MPDRLPPRLRWWAGPLSWPLIAVILAYKATLAPFLGGQCRFVPTCSTYGLEAVRTHGPIRGTGLMLRRLGRCHPLGRGGYDPVPPRED